MVFAIGAVLAPPLTGQSTGTLVLGTEVTRLGGATGPAVNVDWVREGARGVTQVGMVLARVGDHPWGRVSAQRVLRSGEHTLLALQVEAGGGGKGDGTNYGLAKLGTSVTTALRPGRLWGSFAVDGISVDGQNAVIVQPGTDVRMGSAVLALRYGRSFGGELNAEFVLARLTRPVAAVQATLGGVLGRTLQSPASRAAAPLAQLDGTWEVFGGAGFSVQGRPLTVMLKHRGGGGAAEQSVLVSTRIALR